MRSLASITLILLSSCGLASDIETMTGASALKGSEMARKLLNSLSHEEKLAINLEGVIAGFSNTIRNSDLIFTQSQMRSDETIYNQSLMQDELFFLESTALYPMYQRSENSFLFASLIDAKNSKSASFNDGVIMKLSAITHTGETFIPEQTYKGVAANLPKSLRIAATELREGEKRRYVLPSWTMFGAKGYMNVEPYSTIIADLELTEVIPKKTSP